MASLYALNVAPQFSEPQFLLTNTCNLDFHAFELHGAILSEVKFSNILYGEIFTAQVKSLVDSRFYPWCKSRCCTHGKDILYIT